MNLTLPSPRQSRRLLSAVLLATIAVSANARAESSRAAPAASKTAPQPNAKADSPSSETSAPKVAVAAKAEPSRKLPSQVKSSSTSKSKAKPHGQVAASAPVALEPVSPSPPERMTEAGSARRRATIALNTGHYEDAIKAFEEAYVLEQNPILLFRLAQAYRLAGQPTKALDACEAYLRSTDKNTSERALVEKFVVEMEMIAYQIRLQREYGMLPRSGIVPPLVPPAPISPAPAAAESSSSLPAPKLESSRSAELTTAPTPGPVESKPFYKRTYFWVAVGGVVAAGATAAIWYAASSHGSRAPQTALGYQGAYQ